MGGSDLPLFWILAISPVEDSAVYIVEDFAEWTVEDFAEWTVEDSAHIVITADSADIVIMVGSTSIAQIVVDSIAKIEIVKDFRFNAKIALIQTKSKVKPNIDLIPASEFQRTN